MYCLLATTLLCALAPAIQQHGFRQGKELHDELSRPAGVLWSQLALREAVATVSRLRHVAIFLDRRIDPSIEIDYSDTGESLIQCLQTIGRQYGFGVAVVESVVYLGPESTVRKLATLNESYKKAIGGLSATQRKRWRRRGEMTWPRLAEPRKLVAQLSDQSGIPVEGLDSIPHDLWPAGSLPELPAFTTLTILLAGFDLGLEIESDGRCRLVLIPERVALTRQYRVGRNRKSRIDSVKRVASRSKVSSNRNMVVVTGPFEDHQAVRRLLSGKRNVSPTIDHKQLRYTLQAENQPVGPFIKSLCTRLDIEVEFSVDAEDHFNSPVSFQVQNATRADLLDAVLTPAGLLGEVVGNVLHVRKR